MNIQQLEYIVAVHKFRHFGKAARACHVTQPTLSMMIRKLEEELDAKIFDRSRQPVIPTEIGELIVEKAQLILAEVEEMKGIVSEQKGIISGKLQIGIIPTLAPYLIPLFIDRFLTSFPQVKLSISEHLTTDIIELLKSGKLDAGILATPLMDEQIREVPIFWEEFLVYTQHTFRKEYLVAEDLIEEELLLLEEGHCFRSQILNLCELRKPQDQHFEYRSGSLETLIRLVEKHKGVTIIPELAALAMSEKQKTRLKAFSAPRPSREISIVTHRNFIKMRLISLLKECIETSLPPKMRSAERKNILSIRENT